MESTCPGHRAGTLLAKVDAAPVGGTLPPTRERCIEAYEDRTFRPVPSGFHQNLGWMLGTVRFQCPYPPIAYRKRCIATRACG